ncbi:MFS transporter [Crenobacter sp. SG2305]|uniref:MFS transporter n=1 Tax=Crenobacter oryzisoli TaxID=3056844 RepID=UPI0025AA34F2|nr:MFS transporter [Crenobacter sp. SG2305]MDN0082669.1 MFS transporter [Crenobacter sp. SG2305]
MTIAIKRWEPENLLFWLIRGKRIARRNLILSTLALHLNFIVWMMWSMVVVNLPAIGFALTSQQQFLLVSIPPLVGALMRVVYATAWTLFGGGRWLALSTLFLLLPAAGVAYVVQHIDAPFWLLLAVAASCGIGGGASSSHLSNTSFFFPKSEKGLAMGINAGFGNLGVSVAQLLIPLTIAGAMFGRLGGEPQIWGMGSEVREVWLQNAGYVWWPVILIVAAACWLYSHDLPDIRLTPRDQLTMMGERHTWAICLLYMGSYGTFLGFAAAFPLLVGKMFPLDNAAAYAFIGPMVAALSRPFGGWMGDRVGGGIASCGAYALMALGTLGVFVSLPGENDGGQFWLFLAMCFLIFLAAGVGNGASYQLAPKVFLIEAGREAAARGETVADAYARGGKRGAAAMSVSSVMAAFGGFVIPKTFGSSLDLTGSFVPAFGVFLVFYLIAMVVAWWLYARPDAPMRC